MCNDAYSVIFHQLPVKNSCPSPSPFPSPIYKSESDTDTDLDSDSNFGRDCWLF
jgi:hypothetical protein